MQLKTLAKLSIKPENTDYRVLASKNEGNIHLSVHKIYFDTLGTVLSYDHDPLLLQSHNVPDIARYIQTVKYASGKPILWKGTRFPEAYSMTTT